MNSSKETRKYLKQFFRSRKKLSVKEDKVYYKDLLVLKEHEIKEVLKRAHAGHLGETRTIKRITLYYWWLRLAETVTNLVTTCKICNQSKRIAKFREAPLNPIALPKEAWSTVGIDLIRPFNYVNYKYLIVFIDYKSHWPEIVRLFEINSAEIIRDMRKIFMKNGLPKLVITDNGKQFISAQTQEFLRGNSVKHSRTSFYSPQNNGLVERINRTIKEKIEEGAAQKRDSKKVIRSLLSQYRLTPNSTTDRTPFEVFTKRMPNEPLSYLLRENRNTR